MTTLPTPEQWARIVERRGVRDDSGKGCLIWTGSRTTAGYGNFGLNRATLYAHRTSLAMSLGRPLREGACACHHCDTPACFEPSHLYEGDKRTNRKDALERDRVRVLRGEEQPVARLTEDDVREIRRRRAEGALLRVLAAQYGVSDHQISIIALRKSWKHVA